MRENSRRRSASRMPRAERAPGSGGNENPANAERVCESAGVERTGAAKGEQRESTRIVAAFDGDAAEG